MNASPPNWLRLGSHVRLVMNWMPMWVKAGQAWLVVKTAIRARMARTRSPQAKVTTWNDTSAILSLGDLRPGLGLTSAVVVIDAGPWEFLGCSRRRHDATAAVPVGPPPPPAPGYCAGMTIWSSWALALASRPPWMGAKLVAGAVLVSPVVRM